MWVSHSLEQGDIGRILEPLLLLLLHPSTARVSHFYSERERRKQREAKIESGVSTDTAGEQVDKNVHDGTSEDINDEGQASSGSKKGLKSGGSKDEWGIYVFVCSPVNT